MSEQPWETHDRLCSSRRPSVAYPRKACPECRSIDAARAEGYAAAMDDGWGEPEHIKQAVSEALDRARNAVAALIEPGCDCDPCCRIAAALVAIDNEEGR